MPDTPTCPQCGAPVERVRYTPSSALNRDQWDAVRAGDWFCSKCPGNDRGNSPRCYWWDNEVRRETACAKCGGRGWYAPRGAPSALVNCDGCNPECALPEGAEATVAFATLVADEGVRAMVEAIIHDRFSDDPEDIETHEKAGAAAEAILSYLVEQVARGGDEPGVESDNLSMYAVPLWVEPQHVKTVLDNYAAWVRRQGWPTHRRRR